MLRRCTLIIAYTTALLFSACTSDRNITNLNSQENSAYVSSENTPEAREKLFDYLVKSIMETEAFSPTKTERMGASFPEDLEAERDNFLNAQTDEDLFYAIVRLSNARQDRHLRVSGVEDGLQINSAESLEEFGPYRGCRASAQTSISAPIRFGYEVLGSSSNDFHLAKNALLFVSKTPDQLGYKETPMVDVGDVLIGVNGMSIEAYLAAIKPYHCHSTHLGFWHSFAVAIPTKTRFLPASFYSDQLQLKFRKSNGDEYDVSLPYEPAEARRTEPKTGFNGFTQVLTKQNYNLHRHDKGKPVFVLEWLDFEDELLTDVDELIAYAKSIDALGYDIILDARNSSGGSRGAYAIQRLVDRPFKTTFGNIRISPRSLAWADRTLRRLKAEQVQLDGDSPELVGDPNWLIEWLETDVARAASSGDAYSTTVPFKTAHAPKDSDGILLPADTHFSGNMVCIFGPRGGSHLDQMAAIMKDNNLCTVIGMPAGGYSNTWEAHEGLKWPNTDTPIARFMWNIGDTVRPNGEILEGNPAEMDEYIPITRKNFSTYRDDLIARAIQILEKRNK